MNLSLFNLEIERDEEGYLLKLQQWTSEVGEIIAAQENIILTQDHWAAIHFLRNFYESYKMLPAQRIWVKELGKQLGGEKGNSLYLYKLFPKGPLKQASKIAGLPKPNKCL